MSKATAFRRILQQQPDELAINRMWREIEVHRNSVSLPSHSDTTPSVPSLTTHTGRIVAAVFSKKMRTDDLQTQCPRVPLAWGTWMVAALLLLLLLAGLYLLLRKDAAALTLANHQLPPEQIVTTRQTLLHFEDGSTVVASSGTRLDLLVNQGDAIEFALRKGNLSVQVTPGGNRQWTIHCGIADVVVVGTRFEVSRTDASVVVSVSRGTVLVKGSTVPDGVQKLTADMSLRIAAPTDSPPQKNTDRQWVDATEKTSDTVPAFSSVSPIAISTSTKHRRRGTVSEASAAPPSSIEEPAPPGTVYTAAGAPPSIMPDLATENRIPTASPANSPIVTSIEVPDWRQLARQGEFKAAMGLLPTFTFSTLHTEPWSADDLFMLSDVARATHHPVEACSALQEIVLRYPQNPRAGVAAYTEAKITAETLNHPADAAVLYEKALSLRLSRTLRETALFRLIEAYSQTAPEKAANFVSTYRSEFQGGRYTNQVNAIANSLPRQSVLPPKDIRQ